MKVTNTPKELTIIQVAKILAETMVKNGYFHLDRTGHFVGEVMLSQWEKFTVTMTVFSSDEVYASVGFELIVPDGVQYTPLCCLVDGDDMYTVEKFIENNYPDMWIKASHRVAGSAVFCN